MAQNTFTKTFNEMKGLALTAPRDEALVFYSGGKDSLAVMDIAVKTFARVVGVFMYFVRGLDCIEEQLQYARDRWGVEILQYPHWAMLRNLREGNYCPMWSSADNLPDLKLVDIYNMAKKDTGIQTILMGAKASDSLWRRRNLANVEKSENYKGVHAPIRDWNKFDVLAYLKLNDIPVPDSSGRSATGVGLTTPSLLWLHDKHPNDFKKVCKVFPFAEAVVWRREYYGIE